MGLAFRMASALAFGISVMGLIGSVKSGNDIGVCLWAAAAIINAAIVLDSARG